MVNAVVEGLNELFLETAGMPVRTEEGFPLGLREFGKGDAEHVHLNPVATSA